MSNFRKIFISLILLILAHTNSAGQNVQNSPLKSCWRFDAEFARAIPLATNASGKIFVALANGDLISIGPKRGEVFWRAELGGEITGKIIANESAVFLVTRIGLKDDSGASDFRIHAISEKTGVTIWRKSFAELPVLFAESEGSLFGFFGSGTVFSVESANGNSNSRMTYSEKITSAVFAEGKIGVSFTGKKLLAFMPKNLANADRLMTIEEPAEFTLSRNELVLVGDRNGNLTAYDLSSKSWKWRAKTGGEISAIVEIQNGFLVSSVDNFVYLFSGSGKRIWKRRLAGRSFGRPALSADTAAFATLDGDTGYVLELKKGRITDPLFLEEGNAFVSNPVFANDVFVFATTRGLVAYGSEKCRG